MTELKGPMSRVRSAAAFARALELMPGGVNSPVRACRAVGTYPRFLSEGKGSHVIDVDGNEYIDLICSWGPLILGHCHEAVEEAVLEAVRHGLAARAAAQSAAPANKLPVLHQSVGQSVVVWRRGT